MFFDILFGVARKDGETEMPLAYTDKVSFPGFGDVTIKTEEERDEGRFVTVVSVPNRRLLEARNKEYRDARDFHASLVTAIEIVSGMGQGSSQAGRFVHSLLHAANSTPLVQDQN